MSRIFHYLLRQFPKGPAYIESSSASAIIRIPTRRTPAGIIGFAAMICAPTAFVVVDLFNTAPSGLRWAPDALWLAGWILIGGLYLLASLGQVSEEIERSGEILIRRWRVRSLTLESNRLPLSDVSGMRVVTLDAAPWDTELSDEPARISLGSRPIGRPASLWRRFRPSQWNAQTALAVESHDGSAIYFATGIDRASAFDLLAKACDAFRLPLKNPEGEE